MKLYTTDGWIDPGPLMESAAPFVVAVGGRGIGKTYAALKWLLEHDTKFIYLRRTQTQIDACKVPELSPFGAVARDMGIPVKSKAISKYIAGFYTEIGDKVKLISIGVALSTFANIRGFDAGDYDFILFDEFIPEKHERPMSHEGEAFLNVLETINRNRELQGKAAVKCIMLSNSNKLDSPILNSIGAIQPLDKMIRAGRDYGLFFDGALQIIRYTDSPISERKKDTVLYRVATNKDFTEMALNNSFGADAYFNVGPKPLNEFSVLVSVMGITIYRHKTEKIFYVVPGAKGENIYSGTDDFTLRGFRRKYYYLLSALSDGRVYYSTAQVKVAFENIWG